MDLQSTLKNGEAEPTSEPTSMTDEFTQFRTQTEYQILLLKKQIQEIRSGRVTLAEDLETLKAQIKTTEKCPEERRKYLLQVPEPPHSLLLKICDFQRHKADARNGKTLSLFSQPIPISRGGFKMGSSMYCNGDGMGLQRSHSSRIHEFGPNADLTAPPPGASCYNPSYGSPRPRTRRSSSSDDDEALYEGPNPETPRPNLAYEGLKRGILAMFGDVKDPQKRAMLRLGLCKLGNILQTMQDAIDDLVLRASNFLNMPLGDAGGLTKDDLFEAIIRSIPNEKWMRFVRCELNLSEPEIRKIKETCEPTEEQLIQLQNMIQEIHGVH